MTDIRIIDLSSAELELFSDSESFLDELIEENLKDINGGAGGGAIPEPDRDSNSLAGILQSLAIDLPL